MTRYAFIHLEYGQDTRDRSMRLLAQFRHEFSAAGMDVSLLMVDNKRTSGEDRYSDHGWKDIRVIPGDNSNREFTGWDVGVADFLSREPEPDVWLFSNDTIATHHGWSKTRTKRFCNEIVFLTSYEDPWLVGEITDTAAPATTPIGPMLQWFPTYAFAMNRRLRQGIKTLSPDKALLDSMLEPAYEPRHQIFREGIDPGFFNSQLLFLVALDGMEAHAKLAKKMGWKGLSARTKPLDAETFPALSAKMRCTLSEGFLSVRARQAGAVLRSPYEGQQGRRRLRSTIDFVLDKIVEKAIFKRLNWEKSRAAKAVARGKQREVGGQ